MEDKTLLRIFGVGTGLTLALLLYATKPSVKVIVLGAIAGIPSAILGADVASSKFEKRLQLLSEKLSSTEDRAKKAERRVIDYNRIVEAKYQLERKLEGLQQEIIKKESLVTSLVKERDTKKQIIQYLQADKDSLEKQVASLRQEYDELAVNFDELIEGAVSEEVDSYKTIDREQLLNKFRANHSQGLAVVEQADVIAKKSEEMVEIIMQRDKQRLKIFQQVKEHTIEAAKAWDLERDGLVEQIELLNIKVARLQQRLAGDLVEPIYFKCGFSPEGQIANAVAEWLWNHQQIPLKVTGVESGTDSILTAGYSYSHSMPVEELAKVIETNSPTIARTLGLYAIEKPHKLPIADILTLKIRRERPSRKTNTGALYRSHQDFIKYILSQPIRFRLIGEPGAGKTPTVAVMLAHLLARGFLEANTPNGRKLPYTIVEFCNPLAGISVKNSTDLDFCLKWDSGYKGFKGLADECRFRKNKSNANYKNQIGYIWVADEIDNSMAELTKDEAKPFKNSLKDGGHINLGVIVMGQSANVSTSKGLSIDDQKMMTNIYIDPVSIRTFLSQYGERFYSKKTVEKALNTLEEIELEIEEQNEVICDTARELRIAMVTAQRSPVFYQLPYFDSTVIDVAIYQQNLEKVIEIRSGRGETPKDKGVSMNSQSQDCASVLAETDTSGHSPYAESGTSRDTSQRPNCPHCDSSLIRSKGNKWECKNPEHSTIAPGKPKSWKK
ncbi:MAG: hypothetical protein F6J92_04000 [Symploca sp. SIO1A3]|nr:hypothetical protein [Symploca sp. SIO1A3]